MVLPFYINASKVKMMIIAALPAINMIKSDLVTVIF